MPRLAFKKQYVDPILQGTKTTTIRAQANYKVGEVCDATCEWGKPPFALLKVTDVRPTSLWELDDDVAAMDGFESPAELRKELKSIYPSRSLFYVIYFEVLGAT